MSTTADAPVELLCAPRKKRSRGWHVYTESDDAGETIFAADIYKLWELTENAPSVMLAVADLEGFLNDLVWSSHRRRDDDAPCSPNDVLVDGGVKYRLHWRKIARANLDYPILVSSHESRSNVPMEIYDGFHRLARAKQIGAKMIEARVVSSWTLLQAACDPEQKTRVE
jgi:hypothetical protein